MFQVSAAPTRLPSSFARPSPVPMHDEMYVDEDPSLASSAAGRMTLPGEGIASSSTWMRGHGTYVDPDAQTVISSVAGVVERVNKLVSVRPLRARYRPEVGDLVVGRVLDVGPRRWRVDANARQDAVLLLSSVNLPGGVQRRKLESDELQMRMYFQEGDLLVAEVQAIMGEGSISLHTRSTKYGKLRNGSLVQVPLHLIIRLKSHFISLECGVDVILGINGYVWVQARSSQISSVTDDMMTDNTLDAGAASTASIYSSKNDHIDVDTRLAIDRVAACISLLAHRSIIVSDVNIAAAFDASLKVRTKHDGEVPVQDLSQARYADQIREIMVSTNP